MGAAASGAPDADDVERLRDRDRILTQMAAHSDAIFWLCHVPDRRILSVSSAWARIYGRPMTEMPDRVDDLVAFVHPDDRARFQAYVVQPATTPKLIEYRIVRPDGSVRWLRNRGFAVTDDSGRQQELAGIEEDITQAKESQLALEASEARFRAIAESTREMILLVSAQGAVTYATQSAYPLLGYTPEETIGQGADAFVHPDDLPAFQRGMARVLAGPGAPLSLDVRARCKSGAWRHVYLTGTNLLDHPSLQSVVVTMVDVTERVAAQEKALANWELMRSALDALDIHIGIVALDGTLMFANRKALEFIDARLEDVVGRPLLETRWYAFDDEGRARIAAAFPECTKGKPLRFDGRMRSSAGVEVVVDFRMTPIMNGAGAVTYLVPSAVDVTERVHSMDALRRSERALQVSQKMEAVGRLAGGVAHDFNNVVTAILAFADILLQDLPPDLPARSDVEQIRTTALRATSLTRQLLAFSRRQVQQPLAVDLAETLHGMQGMLQRLIGEDIALRLECDNAPWPVFVDPGHVEQVVLNLAVNSRDAMPTGGALTLRVTERNGAHGAQVVLAVRDTGSGMDEDTLSHLFEPFFTTKAPGFGTGLGLSIVYGVVRQWGGLVEVDSKLGQGSEFRIVLPRWKGALASASSRPSEPPEPRGRATVLLVEDEDVLRVVARRVLQRNGYTVLEASEGVMALELLREHAAEVDLVVSDLVMPKMSGRELVVRMREAGLAIPVLLTSGYTEDTLARHGTLPSNTRFLEKPFTAQVFLRAVRTALQTGETAVATAAATAAAAGSLEGPV